MATTTAKAFDEFKAKLTLTSTQRDLVKSRRETCHGYLEKAFPGSSDMPLQKTKLIGSAGRETIIRPLEDVDVLAVFGDAQEVYSKYYGNSRKFLYRVRDALDEYQVEVVGARGQAVRLFYKQKPHVDIAPVLPRSGGGYLLPAGDGKWISTNPDYHETWLAQKNQDLGGYLKPLVRMLRRWNREHSRYFKSFHLEVMAANTFSSLGSNSRETCQAFFKHANISASDPAFGGALDDYMGWLSTRRANAKQAMEAAETHAAKALRAEATGDHKTAIAQWRIVFGDEFPAYG
ncbi:MAG TPA: hypothetical protein DCQ30_10540 [Acidimicrobiaceae bacterium]|nr:hypothetical protein [Acidimicrobiaceae bacterium]